ncbi:hypothetical protein IEQ34_021434 [Dendrobium chrysotoxum]|uniref:Uncharacterized protein n=1 Tax=Dendrobium chrysotoxum TaxID=161865 RepID=A0AAV7G4S9_DENCH|nr:hypothetical protein IEQ34_021434 [Dendrobium chrysotoxum]
MCNIHKDVRIFYVENPKKGENRRVMPNQNDFTELELMSITCMNFIGDGVRSVLILTTIADDKGLKAIKKTNRPNSQSGSRMDGSQAMRLSETDGGSCRVYLRRLAFKRPYLNSKPYVIPRCSHFPLFRLRELRAISNTHSRKALHIVSPSDHLNVDGVLGQKVLK